MAYWAIPAIGLPAALVNLYVAANMAINTPASPPWELAASGAVLLLFGFVLSMIPDTKAMPAEQT